MFNINIEITKNVIYSYTKNILEWLSSQGKDNNINNNTIRSLITESITFSNIEITELIKNRDFQATVNQQAMLLIMRGCLSVVDKGIEELRDYLMLDNIDVMSIITKAIEDVDQLIANSYLIIGLDKNNNNLYLQNINSNNIIRCDGIINYNNTTVNGFLLNSSTIVRKKDINVTDICLNQIIYIPNIKRQDIPLFSIYSGVNNIFNNQKYYKKIYNDAMIIPLSSEWIDVDRLNNGHMTYIVNDSTKCDIVKQEYDNPLILNTFGIDTLPDIIFADIIIVNEFLFTESDIIKRLYKKDKVITINQYRNICKL